MSLPAVHQHLAVLEDAGLVTCEKRGRERWCRLRPDTLAYAERWINDPGGATVRVRRGSTPRRGGSAPRSARGVTSGGGCSTDCITVDVTRLIKRCSTASEKSAQPE
jgi:DNA-binding transcriptional ArsR family regulator